MQEKVEGRVRRRRWHKRLVVMAAQPVAARAAPAVREGPASSPVRRWRGAQMQTSGCRLAHGMRQCAAEQEQVSNDTSVCINSHPQAHGSHAINARDSNRHSATRECSQSAPAARGVVCSAAMHHAEQPSPCHATTATQTAAARMHQQPHSHQHTHGSHAIFNARWRGWRRR